MEPMKAPAAESPANWKRHTAGELELEGVGIIALEELELGLGLGFVSRSVSVEELEESKEAIFVQKSASLSLSLSLFVLSLALKRAPITSFGYLHTTSFSPLLYFIGFFYINLLFFIPNQNF